MWQNIIDASSVEEAKAAIPAVADIPAGSPVRATIQFAWYAPVGFIGNMAGAEWWVPRLAGISSDFQVSDVSSSDAHTILIEGTAKGLPPLVLVAAIAAILGVVALAYFVTRVVIEADITRQAVIQQQTEDARAGFIAKYAPIYGADTVTQWLSGITKPTAEQQQGNPSLWAELTAAVKPAVTIGSALLIGGLLLWGLKLLPKAEGSKA